MPNNFHTTFPVTINSWFLPLPTSVVDINSGCQCIPDTIPEVKEVAEMGILLAEAVSVL